MDNSLTNEIKSTTKTSVTELQRQLSESLKQLSPERLHVLVDFASYLANAETEAATQELLAISGLLEQVKQNEATPVEEFIDWRSLHSDVQSTASNG